MHRFHRQRVLLLPVLALLLVLSHLLTPDTFAASPELHSILPRGAQQGTEAEFRLLGRRLEDASSLLFHSEGLETIELQAEKANELRARIRIAADCPLGEHGLRVVTQTGISELRTIWIGDLPTVLEKEPNNDFRSPQEIDFGVTIEGVIPSEDVDWFTFEAKKGDRISIEIEAMRVGNVPFDPFIAILDERRFELAASDDTPLLKLDGACQTVAKADGKYFVQVRESSYGGDDKCRYRLHIGSFPRPTAVWPAGGRPGEKLAVHFVGDILSAENGGSTQEVELPAEENPDWALAARDAGGRSPSANRFRVVNLKNVLEAEPNDSPKKGNAFEAPAALNGILESSGDTDWFEFEAEKGQSFEVEVFGRRLRTAIDPVLRIRKVGGKQIASDDDARRPDSYLRFQVPETARYAIGVRDHLGRGGPDFVYRVEVSPVRPSVRLGLPALEQYTQKRQVIAVPRGNRYAALLSVSRTNAGGDLRLSADGLPDGVTLLSSDWPDNLAAVPVLFEASSDASPAARLATLAGAPVDEKKGWRAHYSQPAELVYGEPNRAVYWSYPVERLAVAVTEQAPFRIEIVQPRAPIVQNGTMGLRVRAERAEGFKQPILLEFVFAPPGISAARNVTIPGGKDEATIQLNARSNAPARAWKIVVNGRAKVGDGSVWVASPFAELRVAPPPLHLEIAKSSTEQGKPVELFAKVQVDAPFAEKAKLQLFGLPYQVASPVLEIDEKAEEVTFPVTVSKDSPAGRHRNVFCRVEISIEGEPVVWSTGGTELRIDKPLPPKAEKPAKKHAAELAAKKKKKKEPEEKPKKQLSRLERLRREFDKTKEDSGGSRP